MNKKEHLLTCLAEECAEIAQCASKALRFGLDGGEPGKDMTNAQRIRQELDDLAVIVQMICEEEMIAKNGSPEARKAKREKVERYMLYAIDRGTLSAN